MPAAYQLTSAGVLRVADNTHIPNDTRNRDWNGYQDWITAGNTADAIAVPSLSSYKAAKVASVNVTADGKRVTAGAPSTPSAALVLWQSWYEAPLANVDGTPTAGEYPVLNARAVATSSTIAAVATAVVAERAAMVTALAAIEQARQAGVVAINAAGSNGAVDTAFAAITWP